jgi:hypothetical protein
MRIFMHTHICIHINAYTNIGMKRSSIRRVELPSQLTFRAREDKQLPSLSPCTYEYTFLHIFMKYVYS